MPLATRDRLFEVCPEWKMQQEILWTEVLKETKRWKSRWTVRELLADERCGQSVLDFLSTNYGCGKAGAAAGRRRRCRK